MSTDLKEKAVSGVVWSGLQRSGSILLNFFSGIILARLLSPDDYGCIGMLAIFIALSSTFIDGGFGSALIQKKQPTNEDYSTIFIWNVFLSCILYALLFVASPYIARFYNIELLCPVLRAEGFVLIIDAFKIIPFNRLRKQLQFKKIASTELGISFASLLITIVLAWRGFGVWALVCQQLSLSVFSASAYWIISRWKPSFVFSKKSFSELFSFGCFIFLSNMINTLCNNVQGILIGRFFNSNTMGLYSKARQTEELSSTFVSQVVDQVSYPVLAEAQNNRLYMISMLKKFIGVLAYITFPLMLLLILIAKPIFILLYSEKWVESVPYFQILCVAGIAICLQGINYYAVAAVGKSKDLFSWTIIKRSVALALVVGGFIGWGVYGLLWGSVLGAHVLYWINAYLCAKHVGYPMLQQFKDLLPMIAISLIVFLISYGISHFVVLNNIYIVALIQTVLFCMLYMGISLLFKVNAFYSSVEILKTIKRKMI